MFLSLLFNFSSFLIPPLFRQIICIVLIIIYLFYVRKNKIKDCIRYVINEYVIIITCESIIYFIIVELLNLRYSNVILSAFIKVIEIGIIFIIKKNKKEN